MLTSYGMARRVDWGPRLWTNGISIAPSGDAGKGQRLGATKTSQTTGRASRASFPIRLQDLDWRVETFGAVCAWLTRGTGVRLLNLLHDIHALDDAAEDR